MNDTSNTQTPDACATDESLIQSNWKWLAFRGALALLFGVIALFSPLSAVYALTFVFGAYALIDGVTSVVMGVHHAREKAEQWWSLILRGVLGIFAGIAVVLVPLAAAMALVVFNWVMLAMWAISAGVFEFAAGRRLRKEVGSGGGLLMASGAASVLLGVGVPVLLVMDPAAGMLSMGLMMGVYAFVAGILLLTLAFKLRRAAQ
jgi:uncharacterized membrane protein HdeD (DUF308 family)